MTIVIERNLSHAPSPPTPLDFGSFRGMRGRLAKMRERRSQRSEQFGPAGGFLDKVRQRQYSFINTRQSWIKGKLRWFIGDEGRRLQLEDELERTMGAWSPDSKRGKDRGDRYIIDEYHPALSTDHPQAWDTPFEPMMHGTSDTMISVERDSTHADKSIWKENPYDSTAEQIEAGADVGRKEIGVDQHRLNSFGDLDAIGRELTASPQEWSTPFIADVDSSDDFDHSLIAPNFESVEPPEGIAELLPPGTGFVLVSQESVELPLEVSPGYAGEFPDNANEPGIPDSIWTEIEDFYAHIENQSSVSDSGTHHSAWLEANRSSVPVWTTPNSPIVSINSSPLPFVEPSLDKAPPPLNLESFDPLLVESVGTVATAETAITADETEDLVVPQSILTAYGKGR